MHPEAYLMANFTNFGDTQKFLNRNSKEYCLHTIYCDGVSVVVVMKIRPKLNHSENNYLIIGFSISGETERWLNKHSEKYELHSIFHDEGGVVAVMERKEQK